MALPLAAMRAQTVSPSPATMAPSHELIAVSGVLWSTGTGVELAPLVTPAVADEPSSGTVPDDIGSLGTEAPDETPAPPVPVVPAGSAAGEHPATVTVRASARAAVTSLVMGRPCVHVGGIPSSHAVTLG
ncbi:hypothetical protein GCM10023258_22180 [Terrabacter aeriphilus]|uniref:Uncharacterized protein n=1 Tax=Terrabacter aeriphilus TaxID=515662 RepID=A0ABP9JE35_9MICO